MQINPSYRAIPIGINKTQGVNKGKNSEWIQYPKMINGRSGVHLSDLADRIARDFQLNKTQNLPKGKLDLRGQ